MSEEKRALEPSLEKKLRLLGTLRTFDWIGISQKFPKPIELVG